MSVSESGEGVGEVGEVEVEERLTRVRAAVGSWRVWGSGLVG